MYPRVCACGENIPHRQLFNLSICGTTGRPSIRWETFRIVFSRLCALTGATQITRVNLFQSKLRRDCFAATKTPDEVEKEKLLEIV